MFRIENCRIEKFIWCSENNIFKIEKMKLKQLNNGNLQAKKDKPRACFETFGLNLKRIFWFAGRIQCKDEFYFRGCKGSYEECREIDLR